MKFSLHHIVWAFVVCAVWCGVVAYSIDCERDRRAFERGEIARLKDEKALQVALQSVTDAVSDINDGKGLLRVQSYIHGKKITGAFTAKVIEITDGDTIKVLMPNNDEIKVRFDSIDCPEKGQDYSIEAAQATGKLLLGKNVEIHSTGTDRYIRTLAFVFVDGVDVSEKLVADGCAWNYVEYSKSRNCTKRKLKPQ